METKIQVLISITVCNLFCSVTSIAARVHFESYLSQTKAGQTPISQMGFDFPLKSLFVIIQAFTWVLNWVLNALIRG